MRLLLYQPETLLTSSLQPSSWLQAFSDQVFVHSLHILEGPPGHKSLSKRLSPLLRAVQTAEILSHDLGIPYETTDALREYDCGILEGRSDAASWELYEAINTAWMQRQWEKRIEGGESFLDIKARFIPFVTHLIKEYGQTSEQVVLVGHGGLYRCMLPVVLDNIDCAFANTHPMSNTGYVVAEVCPEGVLCRSWHDISCFTTIS